MAIVKWRPRREWDPFAELAELRDEMNRLFSTSLAHWSPWKGGWFGESWPVIDLYHDENNVVVTAEVPGLKQDEVDVSISGNTVTLKGEKKQEAETKEKNYHKVERAYGSFHRSFELPCEIDASKTKAELKNGVLTVTLPKCEAEKPKQIKVDVK